MKLTYLKQSSELIRAEADNKSGQAKRGRIRSGLGVKFVGSGQIFGGAR